MLLILIKSILRFIFIIPQIWIPLKWNSVIISYPIAQKWCLHYVCSPIKTHMSRLRCPPFQLFKSYYRLSKRVKTQLNMLVIITYHQSQCLLLRLSHCFTTVYGIFHFFNLHYHRRKLYPSVQNHWVDLTMSARPSVLTACRQFVYPSKTCEQKASRKCSTKWGFMLINMSTFCLISAYKTFLKTDFSLIGPLFHIDAIQIFSQNNRLSVKKL